MNYITMLLGRQRMQIKGYRPGHRRYAPGPSNQAPSNSKLQPPTSLQNCFYVGYAEVTGDLVRPAPPVGPGAPTVCTIFRRSQSRHYFDMLRIGLRLVHAHV